MACSLVSLESTALDTKLTTEQYLFEDMQAM